jgi:hypothetical protein
MSPEIPLPSRKGRVSGKLIARALTSILSQTYRKKSRGEKFLQL